MKITVTSNSSPDYFEDRTSLGDAKNYEIDVGPWLAGKGILESVVWTVESGGVGIVPNSNIALLSFNQVGRSLISVLFTAENGEKKKIWLKIRCVDMNRFVDDYGMGNYE